MDDRLFAVIVTCNRPKELEVAVLSLCGQSLRPHKIVIIDNSSQDVLANRLNLQRRSVGSFERVTCFSGSNSVSDNHLGTEIPIELHRPTSNIGGAGGFALGVDVALEQRATEILLMDDDGHFENETGLEALVEGKARSGFRVVNSVVVAAEDERRLAFGLAGHPRDLELLKAEGNVLMGAANPFNGCLISSDVFEEVGNIKKEMFIWGDEVEFLYRLKKKDIIFATIVNSVIRHPFPRSKTVKLCGLFKLTIKDKALSLNMVRNIGYLNREYGVKKKSLVIKLFIYYLLKADFKYVWNIFNYYSDHEYQLPPSF